MRPASALAAAKSILEGRGDARYKRSSSLLNSGSAALACAEVVLAGVRPLKAAPPTTAAITVVSRYCLHSGAGTDTISRRSIPIIRCAACGGPWLTGRRRDSASARASTPM
jgi:hypothetical protein